MDLIQPRMEASQQMDEGVYRFVPAEWTSSIGRFCPLRKNAPRASGRREITALPNTVVHCEASILGCIRSIDAPSLPESR